MAIGYTSLQHSRQYLIGDRAIAASYTPAPHTAALKASPAAAFAIALGYDFCDGAWLGRISACVTHLRAAPCHARIPSSVQSRLLRRHDATCAVQHRRFHAQSSGRLPSRCAGVRREAPCGKPALDCDFFEGVVMKRADSIYPVQLRNATEECRGGLNIGLWCEQRALSRISRGCLLIWVTGSDAAKAHEIQRAMPKAAAAAKPPMILV